MIKLTNTLSGRKEELVPFKDRKVNMFVCGPTVYDYSHIGHARTYIFFDVVAKYLRYLGYKVTYLMNITDIDDKIIDRAQKEGKDVKDVAKYYEKLFFKDIENIKIDGVSKFARATDHIKEIIKQIKILVEKGYAYKINDGVYFDISKFADYGKLAKRTVEQAEDGVSRIDESINKRNKGDFALWKLSKPGEPKWPSPWGDGRPGWHIEDTAISEKYLGQQYDIHGGSQDLIFPHHEAEIAQQESASGKKPFVKYWLHSGFLLTNGQKMSKSLGNFITITDILKHYSPESVRMLALSNYYRSPVDYTEALIKQSQAAVNRIGEFVNKLELANGKDREDVETHVSETRRQFTEAMDNDFNTPQAIAAIFELLKKMNLLLAEGSVSKKTAGKIKKMLKNFDSVLGIIPTKKEKVPNEVLELVEKREKLRKEKKWEEADKIRAQIEEMGYRVDDTAYGPLVRLAV